MPSNRLRDEASRILAGYERGAHLANRGGGGVWLGLSGDDIEDLALRKQLGILEGGVLVSHIYPGDPAACAGIEENDVLKMWNQNPINGVDHLAKLLESAKVGEKVRLVVIRQGKTRKIDVQLGKY